MSTSATDKTDEGLKGSRCQRTVSGANFVVGLTFLSTVVLRMFEQRILEMLLCCSAYYLKAKINCEGLEDFYSAERCGLTVGKNRLSTRFTFDFNIRIFNLWPLPSGRKPPD